MARANEWNVSAAYAMDLHCEAKICNPKLTIIWIFPVHKIKQWIIELMVPFNYDTQRVLIFMKLLLKKLLHSLCQLISLIRVILWFKTI